MSRNQKDNGKLVLMDLCATIPEFVLTQNQLAPHREAMNWLNNFCCGVAEKLFKVAWFLFFETNFGVRGMQFATLDKDAKKFDIFC